VVELGDRLGVAMTATRAVYACAKMLDDHRNRRSPAVAPTVAPAM
jgi:hypothetical protein